MMYNKALLLYYFIMRLVLLSLVLIKIYIARFTTCPNQSTRHNIIICFLVVK